MNQREKFEAWAVQQWGDTASFDMKRGKYVHMGIRNHWDAWAAALAASGGNAAPDDSLKIPHTYGGFRGGFVVLNNRAPTDQEIFNAGMKAGRDINWPASAPNADLVAALQRIEKWFGEFPPTGKTWADGEEISYAAEYGSNGERDFMREIARAALFAAGQEVGHG